MKRLLRRHLSAPLQFCPGGARTTAVLAASLLLYACAALENPPYRDLRTLAPIQGDAVAGGKKSTVCASCHGADGVPVAPNFPRLAGQRVDYLYNRLVSFHRADPKDPYYSASPMTAMAAGLSDEDMRDLATYFAGQPPHAPDSPGAPVPANNGAELYAHGDPVRGIPPCQGCHGASAMGPPDGAAQLAAYPSLRGQNAPYLMARLTSYREGRPADTSNTFIMHGVAQSLDDAAIQDLSAWLASLPPGTR